MGKFLEVERKNQIRFKLESKNISEYGRGDGVYKEKLYPFCLPVECAEENLYPPIRKMAVDFFASHQIKWHDGQNGNPSNHMCDSQVCCISFLFPFANQPLALADLLKPIFPELALMLPVEDGQYVSFEWIGAKNYLKEKSSTNSARTRGANFTSADSIVSFEQLDGKKHIVLIEWKYTESYGPISLTVSRSGTSRVAIYQHLFDPDDCPLSKELIPGFQDLFFEPFYQFMRQQFLAYGMEKFHELGGDIVSVLHIAPRANKDFRRITSEKLVGLGESATQVWTKLVRIPGRFTSVYTEDLFGGLQFDDNKEMKNWYDYISSRYAWLSH